MNFSEKLRQLREAADLGREDLATRSGLSRGVIRDYEQGKRKPTLESAVKLARALGTTCQVFAECEDIAEESPKKPAKKRAK